MSYAYAQGQERPTGRRKRNYFRTIFAVFGVLVVMIGIFFASTRLFGYAANQAGLGKPQIGAPISVKNDGSGETTAGTDDSDIPGDSGASGASGAASPMVANQPAAPSAARSSGKPSPSASKKATTAPKVATVTANGSSEDQVVTLVNNARATAGCTALTKDDQLTAAARGHSSDMAARNYFSHDTPEGVSASTRITNAGYKWSTMGENIAMGQATAASVMDAWMNSAGHKANILNCSFRNIGVGLAYDSNKRPYWTQDFGAH